MQSGVPLRQGRQVGGRAIGGVLHARHPGLQRLLTFLESACPGVQSLMTGDDGFMQPLLAGLDGLNLRRDALALGIEVLDALAEFGMTGVDLGREGGELPGVGGHHSLELDLVVLHPRQLLAAAADREQHGGQQAETDAEHGPSSELESVRSSHGDSFPYYQ